MTSRVVLCSVTSSNQWCLSRGIFNYDRKQLVLSRFLVPLASRRLEALVILMLLSSLLPGVLGKHPRLLAFSLVILSARTLADTAVVDLVMSELSMMIIRAMIVSSDFCTLRECLVLHGSPHWRRGVSPGVHNVPPKDVRCVGRTIFMFAWDVSALWRIPPPWGVGILGLPQNEDLWRLRALCGLDWFGLHTGTLSAGEWYDDDYVVTMCWRSWTDAR